jgi:hypothetical protein
VDVCVNRIGKLLTMNMRSILTMRLRIYLE